MTERNFVSKKVNLTFNLDGINRAVYERSQKNVSAGKSKNMISLYSDLRKPSDQAKTLVSINEIKEREKKELELLNSKFASYLEKVRFLEAKNHKLQLDLDTFRQANERNIQKLGEFFRTEINEIGKAVSEVGHLLNKANDRLVKTQNDSANAKAKLEETRTTHDEFKTKIQKLDEKSIDVNGAIELNNRRLRNLKDELSVVKMRIQNRCTEIDDAKKNIQKELIIRKNVETEKNLLLEEINFLKQTHACEIEELLGKIASHYGIDPSIFFKNELSNAINEIRKEYDEIISRNRNALSSQFMELLTQSRRNDSVSVPNEQLKQLVEKMTLSKQGIESEIMNMKNMIADLTTKKNLIIQMIENEKRSSEKILQKKDDEIILLTAKIKQLEDDYANVSQLETNLNAEINKYRSLLEGESPGEGLKSVVNNIEEEMRTIQGDRLINQKMYQTLSDSDNSYYVSRRAVFNSVDNLYETIKYPSVRSLNIRESLQNNTNYEEEEEHYYASLEDSAL